MKFRIPILCLLLFIINILYADEKHGKIIDIIVRLPETNWELTTIYINTNGNKYSADTVININSSTLYPFLRYIAMFFKIEDELIFDDNEMIYNDVYNMNEISYRNILAKNNVSILSYFPEYEYEFHFAARKYLKN